EQVDPGSVPVLVEAPWEQRGSTPEKLRAIADQAGGGGARRAQVTAGELGLHTQLSEMPAGFVVPPHSHSAHELMIVIDGGCTVDDGPVLTAGDMVEFPGGTEYGFTVGDEGIRFVVVRPEASVTTLS
ncbi:MAG: cupin domain-containing protein, partial [Actinomycetota bacterium]